MSDITITCPGCSQQLEVPDELLGQVVECPSCGQSLQLPDPEPKPSPVAHHKKIVIHKHKRTAQPSAQRRSTPKGKHKACPFCGEEILAVAVKCKHCGSALRGNHAASQNIQSSETIGIIALLFPVCSATLAWFWLSNMPLLHDPGSKLMLISVVTVIGTAILVAIEASSVGAGSPSDKRKRKQRENPVTWFFGCLLLWIIAFPMWMARRAQYGLKNLCFAAILVGAIFFGITGFMQYMIEEAKAEVRRSLGDVSLQLEQLEREMGQAFDIADDQTAQQTRTAEERTIINNLKMIDTAKELWAMENNKHDGAPVRTGDIAQHIPGGFPVSPYRATYDIRPIGELPRCKFEGKVYMPSY